MDLPQNYVREMKQGFNNYLPTWVPQTRLVLGDIGTRDGATFVGWSSLKSLGLSADQFGATPWGPPSPMAFQSKDGVEVSFKAGAELAKVAPTISDAKFGAEVKFGKQGAVVFSLKDARVRRIEDGLALRKTILDLYNRGLWEENWMLVSEIVQAASATILISDSAQSSLVLKSEAQVNDIVDLSANVSAVFSSGAQIRFVAEEGLTPLFRAVKVKQKWFRTVVESVALADESQVDYDDMLEPVG